jgi:hypothetical protein
LLPDIAVTHRWSGQVIETNDGIPYVGETAEGQYVATGFSGNGMTFGTLSAMMLTDHARARNCGPSLFDAGRTKIKGGSGLLKENKDYCIISSAMLRGHGRPFLVTIWRGAGEIVEVDGQPAAVPRPDGQIHALRGMHAHGCYVHWNDAERRGLPKAWVAQAKGDLPPGLPSNR